MGVGVTVGVAVGVGVLLGVGVGEGVQVGVAVGVAVKVGVMVGVAVGVPSAWGRASMGAPPMATRRTRPMARVMAKTAVIRLASLLSGISFGSSVSVQAACRVKKEHLARHVRVRALGICYGAQDIRSDVQS